MNIIRLENWSVVTLDNDPYKAPELKHPHLCGIAYGHPKFDDGKMVTTSTIMWKKQLTVVTLSGTYYMLGEVDPEYEKLYPNAKERIFNSLKEV